VVEVEADRHADLSIEDVQAFLRRRGDDEVEAVTRIGLGQWSKAFGYRTRRDGREYIIRFSALDEDFLKDQRAMAYRSDALPVPTIVEIGEAFDGYFAISERLDGEFIDNLDEPGMRRVLPSLFAALDAARSVDLSDTRGFGVWRGDGSGPYPTWRAALLAVSEDPPGGRLHGWREQLARSALGSRTFDAGYAQLRELVDACPEERHLIHSDLLYYNVLVADDRITAVLDWGSSVYGDFLWDLAWFTCWQPWYPWPSIDFVDETRRHFADIGLEVLSFGERLRCCELAIGLGGMAYQAFRGRWSDVEATAQRTLAMIDSPLAA
jgi:hygromycin-B 4-O-kinase